MIHPTKLIFEFGMQHVEMDVLFLFPGGPRQGSVAVVNKMQLFKLDQPKMYMDLQNLAILLN